MTNIEVVNRAQPGPAFSGLGILSRRSLAGFFSQTSAWQQQSIHNRRSDHKGGSTPMLCSWFVGIIFGVYWKHGTLHPVGCISISQEVGWLHGRVVEVGVSSDEARETLHRRMKDPGGDIRGCQHNLRQCQGCCARQCSLMA